ncbi:hypothetical protein ABT039_34730 [Streptomyces lasiicapitis]|uniref:hypothetical protein n=1 Tax=Streptomyces lasiicapitis TaxID=1923961 RepID=UPI00332E912C
MITFIRNHPARIYAVAVAALALVAHYVPDLPSALILGLAAAVLGTGEAVQRAEDRKTTAAGEPTEDEHQGDDQADADELSA